MEDFYLPHDLFIHCLVSIQRAPSHHMTEKPAYNYYLAVFKIVNFEIIGLKSAYMSIRKSSNKENVIYIFQT